MANERLRLAMSRRRVSVEAVATAAEVDPKTVSRWMGGRVPHPRHRWVVARLLQEDEDYLWPGNRRSDGAADPIGEIIAAYPYRSNLPTHTWWDIFSRAESHIDLLGYTLYFLPLEHPRFVEVLREKCQAGCAVRATLADPKSRHVADRDAEEDTALTLVVRIHTTLKYLRPLADCAGFELRFQSAPLYNSVFRFDDEMLVTPHLFATPGSAAPLLRLRRLGSDGLFARFLSHFESIWDGAALALDGWELEQHPAVH